MSFLFSSKKKKDKIINSSLYLAIVFGIVFVFSVLVSNNISLWNDIHPIFNTAREVASFHSYEYGVWDCRNTSRLLRDRLLVQGYPSEIVMLNLENEIPHEVTSVYVEGSVFWIESLNGFPLLNESVDYSSHSVLLNHFIDSSGSPRKFFPFNIVSNGFVPHHLRTLNSYEGIRPDFIGEAEWFRYHYCGVLLKC